MWRNINIFKWKYFDVQNFIFISILNIKHFDIYPNKYNDFMFKIEQKTLYIKYIEKGNLDKMNGQ